MATELRSQWALVGMDYEPITLYECEHITAGTHKYEDGHGSEVSTGEHTRVRLCSFCAAVLRRDVLDAEE